MCSENEDREGNWTRVSASADICGVFERNLYVRICTSTFSFLELSFSEITTHSWRTLNGTWRFWRALQWTGGKVPSIHTEAGLQARGSRRKAQNLQSPASSLSNSWTSPSASPPCGENNVPKIREQKKRDSRTGETKKIAAPKEKGKRERRGPPEKATRDRRHGEKRGRRSIIFEVERK